MNKILVINGPNLNMLGTREPEIYGTLTLSELEEFIVTEAKKVGLSANCVQNNHEGVLIDIIQAAKVDGYEGIIINAGAYTHTSIAILDALKAVSLPVCEVHLSDIAKREEFRKFSYISLIAKKIVCGKGKDGYKECLEFFAKTGE